MLRTLPMNLLIGSLVMSLVGCPSPTPPNDVPDQRVELPRYDADAVVPSPDGLGEIIGGEVLIDFVDDLTDAEVDQILAANNLERAGTLGGVNLITARILDGRSEDVARDAMQNIDGVEAAAMNVVVSLAGSAGSVDPVYEPRGSGPKLTLSDGELERNWPHYAMDTLPALALADAYLTSKTVPDVVLAVVDSGFQRQVDTSLGSESLLSSESGDADVAPKVVDPTGWLFSPADVRLSFIGKGAVDPSSNALIGSRVDFHRLEVAAAAVGSGQDILGTSRHAKLRPVRWTIDPTARQVSAPPIRSLNYLVATLSWLASEDAPNLRVINLSLGLLKSDESGAREIADIVRPHLAKLIAGNRIVVVAAGNEGAPTDIAVMPILGPVRGDGSQARRNPRDPVHAGLLIVGATALPEFVAKALPDDTLGILAAIAARLNSGAIDGDLLFAGQSERWMEVSFPEREFYVAGNFGPHVHVSAPGGAVPGLKTDFTDVAFGFGTSIAAPYVAGLAAEMYALDPTASNVDIIEIIENTADDVGAAGADDYTGHGRINCWKAILTLLNRTDASDPKWIGVRFRWNRPENTPDTVWIGGRAVDGTHTKRVASALTKDNASAVPWDVPDPSAVEVCFSIETTLLDTGDIALLEVRDGTGTPLYQTPARLSDWMGGRVLDSSLDDGVLTLDVQAITSAIYGRVTDDNGPVANAEVRYTTRTDVPGTTRTDSDGLYAVYDAKPDDLLEVSAGAAGSFREAVDVTTRAFRATRQDFILTAAEGVPLEGSIAVTRYVNGAYVGDTEFAVLGDPDFDPSRAHVQLVERDGTLFIDWDTSLRTFVIEVLKLNAQGQTLAAWRLSAPGAFTPPIRYGDCSLGNCDYPEPFSLELGHYRASIQWWVEVGDDPFFTSENSSVEFDIN